MTDDRNTCGMTEERRLELRILVREKYLAGIKSVQKIMKSGGLSGADEESYVRRLLNDGLFLREVEKAQGQIEDTVIRWFKQRALKYAQKMDELVDSNDPRVSFQASKDALDRIGTRPTERVAVSSLDQYRELMKELTGGDDGKPENTADEAEQ